MPFSITETNLQFFDDHDTGGTGGYAGISGHGTDVGANGSGSITGVVTVH